MDEEQLVNPEMGQLETVKVQRDPDETQEHQGCQNTALDNLQGEVDEMPIENNPWQVDSVDAFYFLNCPECVFKSKEIDSFQDHALSNHPMSLTLFSKVPNIKEELMEEESYDIVSNSRVKHEENEEEEDFEEEYEEAWFDDDFEEDDEEEAYVPPPRSRRKKDKKTKRQTMKRKVLPRRKLKTDDDDLPQDFNCHHCTYTTMSRKLFLKHYATIHSKDDNEATITCPACSYEITPNAYVIHYKRVHGCYPPGYENQKKYICDQCPESYLREQALDIHIRNAHNEDNNKEFLCEKCPEVLKGTKHLRNHYKKVHNMSAPGLESYLCDQCPKSYSQQRSLAFHKKYQHTSKKKIHGCPHCDKTYTTIHSLKGHIFDYHDETNPNRKVAPAPLPKGPVECKECGKTLRNWTSYKEHQKNVHISKQMETFQCEKCAYRTHSETYLARHKCEYDMKKKKETKPPKPKTLNHHQTLY